MCTMYDKIGVTCFWSWYCREVRKLTQITKYTFVEDSLLNHNLQALIMLPLSCTVSANPIALIKNDFLTTRKPKHLIVY